MDLMKPGYEFLDLSDVKEADLDRLHCALFKIKGDNLEATATVNWTEPTIDTSSCSSSTAGGPTVSSSVESVSGECEMAPHSPARAAGGGGPPPYAPPPQPPPYAAPPPQQWPVVPPNVYVSQVTANVNVHGYMAGQYYQPQPQYGAPERAPRPHRRGRSKRAPSPPPAPPPYYVQYPHYYPPAQGAPLYHMPMYQQPLMYGPYAYPPYPYPEYQLPVESGDVTDKGPEEYPPEVVMEQEAVDAYYAGAHYAGPPYGPAVDGAMEYMTPMYMPPPPPHPPPLHAPPPHQPAPHQFNVHAKNFVLPPQNKPYNMPPDKSHDQKTPPATASASASAAPVDVLPIKDLKISHRNTNSPKQMSPTDTDRAKLASPHEKIPPQPKPEIVKNAWGVDNRAPDTNAQAQVSVKTFTPVTTAAANVSPVMNKMAPGLAKSAKGPTAPFPGSKQPQKPLQQPALPAQPAVSAPKAPFGNRQKRDGPPNRSPSTENADADRSPVEHVKREPPLPPSKAPMPISITLHSGQGAPLIVTNKSPFGHSRKAVAPAAPPSPAPPPPAPTASDFPPPPTPRNRPEPPPAPQPPPAPGKSWASLFNKSASPAAAPVAVAPTPAPPPPEEPSSPVSATAPAAQKPVAKVLPYDASPLSAAPAKSPPPPQPTRAAQPLSYSEKTSVNAVSASSRAPEPPAMADPPAPPPAQPVPPPVQPSPFADDPNSYRMGEFLSKYQLDNRPVSLLPRGLTNRSNYCYVNAILQALIACPPFYNMLKALPYQTRRGKSSTPVIDAMVELCYEFTPLCGTRSRRGPEVSSLPVQSGAPLDPSAGLRVLRALRPFPGSQDGRQEDAEEFLGCLLNSLNDEMQELMKLVEPEESKDVNQPNGVMAQEQPEEDDDDDEWKVISGPKNKGAVERRWSAGRTPLSDIFRGRTRLRLHRTPTHDVTDAVQPFFTLQLDIERTSSVKDALELLSGKDTLEGVSDAWQQLSLEQLPVVLLLHLKCFQLDAEGHTAKIVKNIDFPIDLKIDQKIISSKLKHNVKQRMYKLFAVVYHEGVEAMKGHYLTDTYHGQAGWIRYDDSTVTLVSDAQVLKPKPPRMPYLLMYRRADTLPPPHRAPPKAD